MSPVYLLLSVALVAVMCPQPGVFGDDLKVTISANPAVAVMIRKNVKLTCTASGGIGTYTYTWTRDGKIVDRQMNKDYQLTAENEGSVTVSCSVKDSTQMTATSANFKVPFYEKEIQAKISADPAGNVKINTNVTLTCGASGGVPPYKHYSWTRGGTIVAGHTKETYELNERRKGEVEVTCKVTDDVDNTKTSDNLIVTFIENPIQAKISADKPGAVKINTKVKLTCTASGGDEVYKPYAWMGCKTITGGKSETCVLTAERKGDVTGSCSVTDSTPSTAKTANANFKVSFYEEEIRAEISADKTCDVKINTIVTFTCKASGGTEVYTTFTWKKGGETVTEHTGKTYELTAKQEGKETVSCSVTDKGNNTATSEVYTVTVSGAIKPTVSLAWCFSLGLILWAVFTSSKVELSL